MFTSNPTNLTAYSLSFLLDWHRQDPVSQKEIDRNQAIYDSIQHNRNPFIDYPELVEYIWGNRVGQAVNLSSMTPTCEGGGYDPTVTFKYAVSWSVCGSINQVDSVIAGRAITALPATPQSCDAQSDVFMGWTTAPIEGTTDIRPVLYTKVADFPTVSADVTYYAVFAKATQETSVTPAVYTFDADHQDGWTNTASLMNQSYWLLDQGKSLTSPDIDLPGLSSITVNIRTYGGTSYCNLDVTANGQPIATIVATSGKTLTDYTWTNNGSFSGRAPLVFSTAYGANQGIGFTRVIINATGAGVTYSRYITTCQQGSEVELIPTDAPARKILVGNQIYIEINNQLYNITGQKIK